MATVSNSWTLVLWAVSGETRQFLEDDCKDAPCTAWWALIPHASAYWQAEVCICLSTETHYLLNILILQGEEGGGGGGRAHGGTGLTP